MHKLSWRVRPLGSVVQAILGISIASTCSLLIISQGSSPQVPVSNLLPETPSQEDVSGEVFGMPVRLKIPKLGIDAGIEQLGVTSDGNMQAPVKVEDVGWYKQGPQPGNKGSAVIAGHFGRESYRGKAVFDDLHTLVKDDDIFVEDDTGRVATFVVREFRLFAKDEVAPDVFTSRDGKAHLNLVTCQGKWKVTEQTYENRLVVFADKTS